MPVFPLTKSGQVVELFKRIAAHSDRCISCEDLPFHTTYQEHKWSGGHTWTSRKNIDRCIRMVVANPYGIGIDVLFEYESYDDKD